MVSASSVFGTSGVLDNNLTSTYFVPNNAAWDSASSEENYSMLPEPDQIKLVAAHVVPGLVWYYDRVATSLKTANGDLIYITSTGGFSLGQNFSFVETDIPLSDGVMHVIDRYCTVHRRNPASN